MRTPVLCLSFCMLVISTPHVMAAEPRDSVVRVLAVVRYPNPLRPWAHGNPVDVSGTGTVIEGKRILTNAHLVLYATEVSVQGRPGEDKFEAKVEAIAPEMDLAILTVKDENFHKKRPALARSKKLPKTQDNVVVYGFPIGGNDLSVTKGVVSRIGFGSYFERGAGLMLQVSAAINPGNSGGPAIVDDAMVGIVFSRLTEGENIGFVIPNEEINLFLEDIKDGRYDGKPVESAWTEFHRLDNESLRNFLKLDKTTKGVLVIPPPRRDASYPLREFDVLTKIGDHEIDNEGMVQLPDDLRLSFHSLIPRLARDNAVPVSLIRQGKLVNSFLPVSNRDNRLLRDYQGEKPSYFVHGPLVFASAKADVVPVYTRMKPALHFNQSPLVTRRFDQVQSPDEELVLISSPMFTHKIAKGYADPVGQVVKEVSGVKIKNLRHLVETIRDCTDEYLTFRFAEEGAEFLAFNRNEMAKVTEEIMEDNGIALSRRGSEDMLKVWKKQTLAPPR